MRWFLADVIGLFSINVVPSARIFSINLVPKQRMFSVPVIYVLSPLQVWITTPERGNHLTLISQRQIQFTFRQSKLELVKSKFTLDKSKLVLGKSCGFGRFHSVF